MVFAAKAAGWERTRLPAPQFPLGPLASARCKSRSTMRPPAAPPSFRRHVRLLGAGEQAVQNAALRVVFPQKQAVQEHRGPHTRQPLSARQGSAEPQEQPQHAAPSPSSGASRVSCACLAFMSRL